MSENDGNDNNDDDNDDDIYLLTAIRLNSRNAKAHHHLASSLFMLYKFKEALQEVELILKINPEV